MPSDSAVRAFSKIIEWAESLPKQKARFTVENNPTINKENNDYFVDYEITISPENINALPITIWLSGDAIGFYIGNFALAARLANSTVSSRTAGLACAGTEPVTSIDVDTILCICDSVSNARLEIVGVEIFGKLKGLHTKIDIGNNYSSVYTNGLSLVFLGLLSRLGISKKVQIPCYKW